VPSTGEEESLVVVQSFDDLSRKLWRLEDLPLAITAEQGAHTALRYTQVRLHVYNCKPSVNSASVSKSDGF